jgi:hypothetical protein
VLAQQRDAELEMRPFHFAIDGFSDVVQERRARGDVLVDAELARHQAREERHLLRVVQNVLTVAGAVLEPPHQPQELRMDIVEAQLEGGGGAVLPHLLLQFRLHLLDHFFDAGGVDAAIGNQPPDRLPRNFAAVGVVRRQDDRAGRVIDDEVDARGELEGADVAAFAADDAPFQIVARQIDDRYRGFDGVFRRAALNGVRDDLLRAVARRLASLGLETFDDSRCVTPRVALHLLQEDLACLLRGEARDALELALALGGEVVESCRCGLRRAVALVDHLLARTQRPLLFLDLHPLLGGGRVTPRDRLLHPGDRVASVTDLVLRFQPQLVRALFGFEQRFLPEGIGFAPGIAQDSFPVQCGLRDDRGGFATPRGEIPPEHRA